ncbi:hypothetical protein [Streptomyces olivoreticuli]|uniref:deoxynucleotide monophosphate kinase family protein n=1 Tax=Streptomyces olivoreticuli TaxID=68246 RepID=UPI000E233276|nr:hypothetical protein [Streptomyces olivoreticuli]
MQGIGIIGRARSGKDTVAARLVEAHGFQRMALADPLKDMALGVDPVICYEAAQLGYRPVHLAEAVRESGWETVKERHPEARCFLQRLGTEGVREHVSASHWVDALINQAEAVRLAGDGRPVVVPDVRFDNEVRALEARGFTVWAVERAGVSFMAHQSEQLPLKVGELTISNNGTLADLYRQVDAAMARTREYKCDTH